MQQPLELDAPPCVAPHPATDVTHDRRAPWLLGGVLALGAFTQALFWNAHLGVNWLIWDVAMVALTLALLRRPRLEPTAIVAAIVPVLFGVALVVHRSTFTIAVALPCNVLALALLPVIVGEGLGFTELATIPRRLFAILGRAPSSIARTALLPSDAVAVLDVRGRGLARGTLAGLVLGVPAAGFFALLLAADPGFASTLSKARDRVGAAATFCAYAAVTAIVYAFAHALYVRTLRAKADEGTAPPVVTAPYRRHEASFSLASFVSPLTWGLVVGQVAAVFGVFVVVHADTEFGGHDVVRVRSGLTYAGHLHAGFLQLLLATLLSVCLVLVGHALLRARARSATSPASSEATVIPGGATLSALESTLLVLTGFTLVSCMQRLKLYEEAYGATLLRLGVCFVGLAVAALLLCTLAKAVFRSFRGFIGTAMAALTAVAVSASMFDADAYVARTNLDRVGRGAILDEDYLAGLSADACAASEHPVLSEPRLRARLIRAWGVEATHGDLRSFRGLTSCPAMLAILPPMESP